MIGATCDCSDRPLQVSLCTPIGFTACALFHLFHERDDGFPPKHDEERSMEASMQNVLLVMRHRIVLQSAAMSATSMYDPAICISKIPKATTSIVKRDENFVNNSACQPSRNDFEQINCSSLAMSGLSSITFHPCRHWKPWSRASTMPWIDSCPNKVAF